MTLTFNLIFKSNPFPKIGIFFAAAAVVNLYQGPLKITKLCYAQEQQAAKDGTA